MAAVSREAGQIRRMHIVVRGAVQGVGFRPFVYRLATEMSLPGWVINSAQGVFVEVEGSDAELRTFLERLEQEKPSVSFIQSLEHTFLDAVGFRGFEIRQSEGGAKTALILPDLASCPDCVREIHDPGNRRYRYAFTNCTNCGPRFTIIESLPYDRPRTTMKRFEMCPECSHEYHDPLDRRFHAQPNACPVCGPQLALWDGAGAILAERDEALQAASAAIRRGEIVALKGIGGFHLMVDARNEDAVRRLRERKRREEKPLALMYPSYERILADCEVSPVEARLVRSPECPIVLLRRRISSPDSSECDRRGLSGSQPTPLADSLAPRNPNLGVMLPYSPLHHLLLRDLGFPVVATSGNLSDEPICIDEREALERLSEIADVFLVHNRPILRHVDDSIVREIGGRELVLRRARGFAPLPVQVEDNLPKLLAVGAHQKNTIAASLGKQVFVSQHIGDLETVQSLRAFHHVVDTFQRLYELDPPTIACDMHPDYSSTQYAAKSGKAVAPVQHHYAHVLACMAENRLKPPVLGVSWDGSGYGPDHTIWGGEFLLVEVKGFRRVAHLRPFRLPGGEAAVKEPRRVALALLYEMFGEDAFAVSHIASLAAFSAEELRVIASMLKRGVNSPLTSSMGRLFDGVASLIGLRQRCAFEGQAAMELEFAISQAAADETYLAELREGDPLILDWQPMLQAILQDAVAGVSAGTIAARFHNSLAGAIGTVARRLGVEKVALTGGCFQNKYLTDCAVRHIEMCGCRPYWHQRIPPNDGGIALGQLMAAAREE